MTIQPISKIIYDKAKLLDVETITLQFTGGNDEGALQVDVYPGKYDSIPHLSLEKEIENWAWEVYQYSGAGDGDDYGDDITYDLKDGTVSSSNWYTSRCDRDNETIKLELEDKVTPE